MQSLTVNALCIPRTTEIIPTDILLDKGTYSSNSGIF